MHLKPKNLIYHSSTISIAKTYLREDKHIETKMMMIEKLKEEVQEIEKRTNNIKLSARNEFYITKRERESKHLYNIKNFIKSSNFCKYQTINHSLETEFLLLLAVYNFLQD